MESIEKVEFEILTFMVILSDVSIHQIKTFSVMLPPKKVGNIAWYHGCQMR